MVDYWNRRNAERDHINTLFENDAEYKKAVNQLYKDVEASVETEINNLMVKFADDERLSMSKANVRAERFEIDRYDWKKQRYIDTNVISKKGQEALDYYNVNARMNSRQLLLENIRLETIRLADGEDRMLSSRLTREIADELKRQSGIFGEIPPSTQLLKRLTSTIVNADYKNAHFSDRIWSNQQDLQSGLDEVIRKVLIQGDNPKKGLKEITKLVSGEFKNKRFHAERIAVTESARVQSSAQESAFEEYGIDEVEWVAEPDSSTCEICSSMDGKIFKREDIYKQSYTIPAHPFCRCSYAGVMSRDKYLENLEARGL